MGTTNMVPKRNVNYQFTPSHSAFSAHTAVYIILISLRGACESILVKKINESREHS